MNTPQQQIISGNVYGGYVKLDVEIYNAKAKRNDYGDMLAFGPYSYKGGGVNSNFVWFIPLDVGTGYTSWYTNYMPGPEGWTVANNKDWLQLYDTPIALKEIHINNATNYIVIDGNTGKTLDLYGRANTFYFGGLDAWPSYESII